MNSIYVLNLLLFIITFLLPAVLPSNILFFHLVATSSHRTSIWPLAEKLADKGHYVTYIFPMRNPPGNHHHQKIEEIVPSKMVPILRDYVGHFDINFRLNNSVDTWTTKLFSKCLQLCEAFYDSDEIKEWLGRPNLHYDLVMIDALPGDCAYGLVHLFKAKHILFTPVIPHFIWDAIGIVPESSSIPEGYYHRKPTQMSMVNRLLGTYATISWRFEFLNFLTQMEAVIKVKLNVDGMPSLTEFERNTSLILVNSHFIDDYPMALPPIVQSYSGLWCSKEKLQLKRAPLSKEIVTFLGDCDGFVYVSFGSSVVASSMPPAERNMIFQAFRSFPKLKFLWKWDEPYSAPENTPENLLLRPWFPQRDILMHEKIKGFITQAGRPSAQEAICHAVPMITIPIFADQDYNADRLEYLGVSINLDIGNISTAALQWAIVEIALTDKYKNRIKKVSKMYRDRPLDPLENAVYWAEYVLRHDDTWLLKPLGIKQSWYQRRLLDIYALGFAIMMVIGIIFFLVLTFVVKCIGSGRPVKNLKRKQN